jgi:hypothetical protein
MKSLEPFPIVSRFPNCKWLGVLWLRRVRLDETRRPQNFAISPAAPLFH